MTWRVNYRKHQYYCHIDIVLLSKILSLVSYARIDHLRQDVVAF